MSEVSIGQDDGKQKQANRQSINYI